MQLMGTLTTQYPTGGNPVLCCHGRMQIAPRFRPKPNLKIQDPRSPVTQPRRWCFPARELRYWEPQRNGHKSGHGHRNSMLSSCEHRHWDLDSNILDLRNVHTNRHLNPNELGYRNVDRHRVRLENRQWTHPQTRPKDPQQKSPQAPQPKSPPKDHVSQRGRASGSNPHPQASDHPENKTLPGKSHAPDKQTKTWENAVHHQKRLTRRRHPQRTTRHREHLEISWKGERANRPWSLQNFHQICKRFRSKVSPYGASGQSLCFRRSVPQVGLQVYVRHGPARS
jgi:hypothetical protein